MLFVCYVTIDPENRDESIKRFKERGIVSRRARSSSAPGSR